jgi:glutamate-1-semialdehyde 2,1-aminomutase
MMTMNPTDQKHNQSQTAYAKACRVIPGGVNSPVRAFREVEMPPVFIRSAKGSRIVDIDGNEYIDYVGSWGPMILGHAHPAVVKAVQDAAANGTSYGAPTEAETQLAARIVHAFPSIQKVRLVSSGTEAVMTAVRLARAFTGRDLIVKMIGCYHGHSDSMLVKAGSGVAEFSIASSAGVPADLAAKTIAIPYNNINALKLTFEKYPKQLAAVIIEPVAANMGIVPPLPGYLDAIRNLCSESKTVLIFDEVITGFRVAFGGAQQLYGIQADLTCLGKIVGGGLPCAAIGGHKKIMDLLAPLGPVYQAGTLSGNPLAVAAANTTLEMLKDISVYKMLEQRSAVLEQGLSQSAQKAGVAMTINRVGSILSCFFTQNSVQNFDDVKSSDSEKFKQFFAHMLQQGIYLAPSAYEAMFVSLAHSEEDIEKTIEAAYNALISIRKNR